MRFGTNYHLDALRPWTALRGTARDFGGIASAGFDSVRIVGELVLPDKHGGVADLAPFGTTSLGFVSRTGSPSWLSAGTSSMTVPWPGTLLKTPMGATTRVVTGASSTSWTLNFVRSPSSPCARWRPCWRRLPCQSASNQPTNGCSPPTLHTVGIGTHMPAR